MGKLTAGHYIGGTCLGCCCIFPMIMICSLFLSPYLYYYVTGFFSYALIPISVFIGIGIVSVGAKSKKPNYSPYKAQNSSYYRAPYSPGMPGGKLESQVTGALKKIYSGDDVKCSSCGTLVERGSQFCQECGVSVQQDYKDESDVKCSSCGNLVIQGAKFCQECGIIVSKGSGDESKTYSESYVKCSSCGTLVERESHFCQECGASMQEHNR